MYFILVKISFYRALHAQKRQKWGILWVDDVIGGYDVIGGSNFLGLSAKVFRGVLGSTMPSFMLLSQFARWIQYLPLRRLTIGGYVIGGIVHGGFASTVM